MFLALNEGNNLIHFLDRYLHVRYTHWIYGINKEIICNGNCPFCKDSVPETKLAIRVWDYRTASLRIWDMISANVVYWLRQQSKLDVRYLDITICKKGREYWVQQTKLATFPEALRNVTPPDLNVVFRPTPYADCILMLREQQNQLEVKIQQYARDAKIYLKD